MRAESSFKYPLLLQLQVEQYYTGITTPIFSAPAAGFLGTLTRKCLQTVYKLRFYNHIY